MKTNKFYNLIWWERCKLVQIHLEIWTNTFWLDGINIPVSFKWVVGNIHLRSIECNPESHLLLVKSQVVTTRPLHLQNHFTFTLTNLYLQLHVHKQTFTKPLMGAGWYMPCNLNIWRDVEVESQQFYIIWSGCRKSDDQVQKFTKFQLRCWK